MISGRVEKNINYSNEIKLAIFLAFTEIMLQFRVCSEEEEEAMEAKINGVKLEMIEKIADIDELRSYYKLLTSDQYCFVREKINPLTINPFHLFSVKNSNRNVWDLITDHIKEKAYELKYDERENNQFNEKKFGIFVKETRKIWDTDYALEVKLKKMRNASIENNDSKPKRSF